MKVIRVKITRRNGVEINLVGEWAMNLWRENAEGGRGLYVGTFGNQSIRETWPDALGVEITEIEEEIEKGGEAQNASGDRRRPGV